MNLNRKCILFSLLLLQMVPSLFAADSGFFKIDDLQAYFKAPKDMHGLKSDEYAPTNAPPTKVFLPFLEVKLTTKQNIASTNTYVRGYFFNDTGTLIRSCTNPAMAQTGFNLFQRVPILYKPDAPAKVCFQIPQGLTVSGWHAVVVFGDKDEAVAQCYPMTDSPSSFNYPEKTLVEDFRLKNIQRKVAIDPLVEHVVLSKLKGSKYPKMTLFLRMPDGVDDAADLQGTMAICVLAGSINRMRADLQKPELTGDYCGLYKYANTHKMAIVAWGVPTPNWDVMQNYDEMVQKFFKSMEDSSDDLANTWERGVLELSEQYGIPKKDYLLWGVCGAAQWAQRLCLRKPDYFLATYMLIPCSFDKPVPEAGKVLWCLCTGELFGGYQNSLKWYAESRKMGYPIFYKAYEGLGHATSAASLGMAFKFFDFALTQKDLRDQHDSAMESRIARAQLDAAGLLQGPWPTPFRNPPFYGDIVNQEVFPADQVEMIPEGFRTPLPTKELADYWKINK